jgi:hypothetical protein
LKNWQLEKEAPKVYTVQEFAALLNKYGPLWVTSAGSVAGKSGKDPHARIVSGIMGVETTDDKDAYDPKNTILTVYDPWNKGMKRYREPNSGSYYDISFEEFMNILKLEGKGNPEIIVAHL